MVKYGKDLRYLNMRLNTVLDTPLNIVEMRSL